MDDIKKGDREMQCYIQTSFDVDQVDLLEYVFNVNGKVEVFWTNPNIKSIEEIDRENAPLNWEDMVENAIEEEALSDPVHYMHSIDGLNVFQGIYHVNLTCFETFELAQFPCDRQICSMEMTFNNKDYTLLIVRPDWASPQVIPDMENKSNGPKMMLRTRLGDKICGLFTMDLPIIDTTDDGKLNYKIRISRKAGYYKTNILLPMFVIFGTNFPVVQIDVADVADRLATTATVLFAVTAYQFAIMEMVPSGGTDQSLVDKYVLFTTILIVTSLGETFFLGVAMNDWELSEESAVNIDTWFFAINAVVWVLLHIFILWADATNFFVLTWEQTFEEDVEPEPFLPQGDDPTLHFVQLPDENFKFLNPQLASKYKIA